MFKNTKFFLMFSVLIFSLSHCSNWQNFEDAVTGAKKQTTDEFLIKSKDPLVLPPDFDNLPFPEDQKKEQSNNKIENILTKDRGDNSDNKSESELEKKIREELKK
tara:strand:+ start:6518 stop:6832 length:315 start_codon:yes stop_codon:yes gene_type:complete